MLERVRDGERMTLAELDARLDLSVEGFAAGLAALLREFRERRLALEVPDSTAIGRLSRVNSDRQYRAEIGRLPQMDRQTEFVMAKRFEFSRARLVDALTGAGVDAAAADAFARLTSSALPELPVGVGADERAAVRSAYEDHCRIRNLFVEGALYLVLTTAHRYRNLGVDLVDLIQEGNASLFQAVAGFDWRRDVRFRTYAQYWVQQAMLKALYNSSRTVRVPVWVQKTLRRAQRLGEADPTLTRAEVAAALDIPAERLEELHRLRRGTVSLDAPASGQEDARVQQLQDSRPFRPEGSAERHHAEVGRKLEAALSDLPTRERSILVRRYGLRGTEPETLGEIAVDLGVSAERVRQLQNAAIKRLKTPALRRRLEDSLSL